MRAPLLVALVVATGCSTIIGIEDPSPGGDDGDDGGPRTLMSIKITPDPLELPLGVSQQLVATGRYSDGSTDDLTSRASWSLVDGASISLTVGGLVKALAAGDSNVSAVFGGVTGQTRATVGTAAPDHVEFTITDFGLSQEQLMRLKVTLVLTDGTKQDATGTATLTSDNDAIATSPSAGVVAGKGPGVATITASAFTATPATIHATVSSASCHVVINEFTTGSPISPAEEYIELFNPCSTAVVVQDWRLVYRSASNIGASDTNLMVSFTTIGDTMNPGELRLYGGDDYVDTKDGGWTGQSGIMQQNNGGIGLRDQNGALIDAIGYGNVVAGHPFTETTKAPMMVNGMSASREPFDGNDTNDNGANIKLLPAGTPRTLNAP